MKRSSFRRDGLVLSYLDSGGNSPGIVALHPHWMEASTFSSFAQSVGPTWRVIALDQRGHGYSDHPQSYAREEHLGDVEALLDHLGMKQAILLGNSLGGVNAYDFASRHPERVPAIIIVDIGVEVPAEMPPMIGWDATFAQR